MTKERKKDTVRNNAHDVLVELLRDASRAGHPEGQSPTPLEWEAHLDGVAARVVASADTTEPADTEEMDEESMSTLTLPRRNPGFLSLSALVAGLVMAAAAIVLAVTVTLGAAIVTTVISTVLAAGTALFITWLRKKGFSATRADGHLTMHWATGYCTSDR